MGLWRSQSRRVVVLPPPAPAACPLLTGLYQMPRRHARLGSLGLCAQRSAAHCGLGWHVSLGRGGVAPAVCPACVGLGVGCLFDDSWSSNGSVCRWAAGASCSPPQRTALTPNAQRTAHQRFGMCTCIEKGKELGVPGSHPIYRCTRRRRPAKRADSGRVRRGSDLGLGFQ